MHEFKFPDVGEGIKEGEVVKWLVKEGEVVKENQNIVQVETDKAIVDLPSPKSGKISKIKYKEGQTVQVGEILVLIEIKGSKEEKAPKKGKEGKPKEKGAAVVGEIEVGEGEFPTETLPSIRQAKPMVAKAQAEAKAGAVVKKKYDQYGYLERVPLKGIRKTIAENMVRSLTESAQVTAMDDIDVTRLWGMREKEKKAAEKKKIKLTFLPYIIKACIESLKKHPLLNASIEGDEIILKKYYNMGIAVETDAGLMVPVIKIAENKSIEQIAKEIQEISEKAKSRKIDLQELKGSTFTITNYGSVIGNYATPIINPGESAILGTGRIFDRLAIDDKGKVSSRKILPVSVTFDHRILDGAELARFLLDFRALLENPEKIPKK